MMEEVNEESNGESSFEFIAHTNTSTSANLQSPVADGSRTTPVSSENSASSQKVIENYFTVTSGVGTPSDLPVFDIKPNITSIGGVNSSTGGPMPMASSFASAVGAVSKPPIGAQTVSVLTSPIPSIPVKSKLPAIPSLPPPLANISQLNAQTYFRPEKTFVPQTNIPNSPAQPITSTIFQPSIMSTTLDFSTNYVTSSDVGIASQHTEDSSGAGGLIGWLKDSVKGNDLLNKFAEKAKSSVDSVIYTLDPQMKDFLNSPDVIDIVVTSDKDVKVFAMKEAFQSLFVKASVHGYSSMATIAEQPVGFTSALKGAEDRINNLRHQGILQPQQTVISIENFIIEATPDNWYDIGFLLLQDIGREITIHAYTQATPIESRYVMQAQDQTPNDYSLRCSGLAVPIGKIISNGLSVPHTEWHQAVCGVSRKEILVLAGKTLAGLYKSKLKSFQSPTITM